MANQPLPQADDKTARIQRFLEPQPLPADFNQRLVQIYRLAVQRWEEHHAAEASTLVDEQREGGDDGSVAA